MEKRPGTTFMQREHIRAARSSTATVDHSFSPEPRYRPMPALRPACRSTVGMMLPPRPYTIGGRTTMLRTFWDFALRTSFSSLDCSDMVVGELIRGDRVSTGWMRH